MATRISKLADAPSASRPAFFNQDAEKFTAGLPRFRDEANALADEMEANAQKIGDAKADADRAEAAKNAAVSAADQAVSCAGAIEVSKNALADASSTLNEMKNIVNNGFIDDTSVNENRSYSSKKIEETFFKKTGEVTVEKLKLKGEVGDDVLAANSTVLFSENGKELVRKASINKLKELIKTEVDLSEYIKKTDADNNYLGATATASDSEKLGGLDASDFLTKTAADSIYAPVGQTAGQSITQISGASLDLGQNGTNFAIDGANGLEITAQASAAGKSGYIVVSNTSSSTTYGANCVVHGKKPQEAEIILSYFVQSPSKIHLSYTASDNSISEDLIEITQNGEKKIILSKAFTEIPATTYTQKVANSYSLEGANIKKIVNSQFSGHAKIASVLFPSVVEVGESAFYDCPNLLYVSLPNLKTAGRWCFSKIGVKELSLPNLTTIDSYLNFTENPNLETLIIPKAVFTKEARIGSNCPKLKKIVCKQGMASVIKTGLSNAGQWEMAEKIQFEEV